LTYNPRVFFHLVKVSIRKLLIFTIQFWGFWLIDWQLIVGWGTDDYNSKVLDFTTIPHPRLNLGDRIFWCNYFVFILIKSSFCVHVICTTINPDWGNHHVRWLFKDKSWVQRFAPTGDWTQPSCPLSNAITIRPRRPRFLYRNLFYISNNLYKMTLITVQLHVNLIKKHVFISLLFQTNYLFQ